MSDIKFSVIVPAYGVERYITDALGCLVNQTYDDFEVIVVDDCSPARSGAIAKNFADRDDRFTVVRHDKNRGVSAARNTGIEHATGEYVLFLDPDDTYDNHLLEVLSMFLKRNRVDVAIYSHTEDYRDKDTGKVVFSKKIMLDTIDYTEGAFTTRDDVTIHKLCMDMERNTMLGYPWNKAYRLDVLRAHDVRYQRIQHVEDVLFNCDYFDHVHTMTVITDILYHYRNQGQPRLTGGTIEYYFELQKTRINRVYEQQQKWQTCDYETLGVLASEYFRSFQSMIIRHLDAGKTVEEVVAKCQKETETEIYQDLRRYLPKDNKKIVLLYEPMAEGKFITAIHRAKVISFIREKLPGVYNRAKQIR